MSFLKRGEIYHFDKGAIPRDHAVAHRNDDFPAGYSSVGCSPALPPPLHQPAPILEEIALAAQLNSIERRTVS
jgi:hypothetical protein